MLFVFGFATQLLGSSWAHTRDQIWVLGSKHRVLTTGLPGDSLDIFLLCPINQVHVNAIHMGKLFPELSEMTRLFRINAAFTFHGLEVYAECVQHLAELRRGQEMGRKHVP